VYFENKIRDIGRDLDRLTRTILVLFAFAYVIIIVVLKFFYSWRHTLKIASIPLLIVLVICSVFAANGIYLEFFSITGMILVFGLGLDYVIYMIENEKRHDNTPNARLEPFAILLSFLTTAVSFGALALSSFVPVHMLGLSIFLGLTTAFLCTIL
jgi:predicted exporter